MCSGSIQHNPISICRRCSADKKLKHALIDLAIQRELEVKMADIDSIIEVVEKWLIEAEEGSDT